MHGMQLILYEKIWHIHKLAAYPKTVNNKKTTRANAF